ncbi:MAG: putative lipid II flippase FtsW [Verrucomicrobiota bacterium]|jgi:cell division protein FtsW|nr:putative lipid II flippase FtsW [Verrucomicrobiota bacterium]
MRKTLVVLSVTVFLLLGIGVVLVATAGGVRAQSLYNDPHHFLVRQLIWCAAALAVWFAASRFDYHWWTETRHLTFGLCVAVLLALALVVCPGIRHEVKGSFRWLSLGPLSVQPSEVAKVLTVIAMSVWLSRIGYRIRLFWKGAVFPALGLGAVAGLLVLEPDYGATMVVCLTGGMLMFVAGTRLAYLAAGGALGLAGVGALVLMNSNRWHRITEFLNDTPYQVQQSLLAFQSGGWGGVGFNNSLQKWHYLPEAHTDFIYAIGGEEFGFVFSILVLAAYVVILVCGLLISMNATDRLGRLLAIGMTFLLVFQAAWNIAVVTGCTVTKGLALPFISYGGTNLVTALAAVGTLLNVGRHIGVYDEAMHTQVVKNAAVKL